MRYRGGMPPETLVVRDPGALARALDAFRRPTAAFGPADLGALASADPGHDERLDPRYREAVLPFYASSLLGERAAASYAARAAIDERVAPLAPGFEQQARDEARHAALDEMRLAQLGADPERAADITPGVAREMAESLEVADPFRRMFLTNFVGESALAAATFPFVIALARANADVHSVVLNRERLADEQRHVRFAVLAFEALVAQDERNRSALQRWQDEHFAEPAGGFLAEVVPALERAPRRPEGDWLGEAVAAYGRRASRLGLRPPALGVSR